MPNFTCEEPISNGYNDIQCGTGNVYTMGITVLLINTVIASELQLIIRLMAKHPVKRDETY
ncbi:hypothetical protein, partial [Bacillus subtilis]